MGIGWIVGGVLLYFFCKKLHSPETNNVILYDENNMPYIFKKHTDTLFLIPMEYCSVLWVIGGIVYYIYFFNFKMYFFAFSCQSKWNLYNR